MPNQYIEAALGNTKKDSPPTEPSLREKLEHILATLEQGVSVSQTIQNRLFIPIPELACNAPCEKKAMDPNIEDLINKIGSYAHELGRKLGFIAEKL